MMLYYVDYTCITTYLPRKAPPTMMIKCQKCGFENQMGSIFCRECGEKLDMDAIDPNKLQKDVNKEKNIKLAKKRVKSAISAACSILIIGGFIFAIIYRGWEDNKDYSVVEETESDVAAAAQKKFDAVMRGTTAGTVKYTYPEINYMFRDQVVKPLYEVDSFAKIVSFEMGFNEEKNEPMANIWIKIKDKVPVRYVVQGDFFYTPPDPDAKDDADTLPINVDVKRLDIGLIPFFFSMHTFLNGLTPLLDNESMRNFFRNAKTVEFTPEGMSVEFGKGGAAPASSMTPTSNKPSSATAVAALKGGSAAAAERDEAARQKAEAARQKAEEKKQKAAEEAEKKKALEEERKRKAEEYKQQQKEKEEERKRKAEEERERKKQEKEERERQIREENERRRQEREDRRNNNYNNNNRNSRNNRNNRW